jgi:sucrose-6-phosphate hydrolase SacC (GH32 family)
MTAMMATGRVCWAAAALLLLLLLLLLVAAAAQAGAPSAASSRDDRPVLHATSPNGSLGDAVGLNYNRALQRYEVMWDSGMGCGWGHASTMDFLTYTSRGCSGPSRIGGPVMSGSVAVRADGTPLAVVGWYGDIFLSSAEDAAMRWFSPPPNASTPVVGPCNCKYQPQPRGCSASWAPDVNCTFMNDPFLFSEDGGHSFFMLTSGSRGDQNGPTGVPQALLWYSDDSPSFQRWSFASRFWHGDYERYGPRTSCVDTFTLPLPAEAGLLSPSAASVAQKPPTKQVFIFSDCKLHRDRWFTGTLNAAKELQVERQGVVDWGRLYASQSMADATGSRRLLLGNIGHPAWCTGPRVLPMPFQMLSLPRDMSLTPTGALRFEPAWELQKARVGAGAVLSRVHCVSAPKDSCNGTVGLVLPEAAGCGLPGGCAGPQLGSTREILLHLRSATGTAAGGDYGGDGGSGVAADRMPAAAVCGVRLWSPASRCSLVVGFGPRNVIVQSSCVTNSNSSSGEDGRGADLGEHGRSGHQWVTCPADAGDHNATAPLLERAAGYCYNVSLPPLPTAAASATTTTTTTATTNASLRIFVDRTAVEVFSTAAGGDASEAGVVISSGVHSFGVGMNETRVELLCHGGGDAVMDIEGWILSPDGKRDSPLAQL